MFSLHGTPIGGGIVIGRARVLEPNRLDAVRYRVDPDKIEAEIVRFEAALAAVRDELALVGAHLPDDAPAEAGALLDVHAMILDDPSLVEQTRASVRDHGWNAEYAFASQASSRWPSSSRPSTIPTCVSAGGTSSRSAGRVLRALSGSRSVAPGDAEQAIVVASDISPADMLSLKRALGFAIDLGGTTSHTAILARSLNVPAVVGLSCASEIVRDDDWLILDGETGVLIVAPDEAVLAEYRHRQAASLLEQQKLRRLIHVPARTLDGVAIGLHANIELPEEAEQAWEAGAAGVGPVPFRIPLPQPPHAALRRGAVRGLCDGGARDARQAGHHPHARRRCRQDPVSISDESAVPPNPALGLRAIRYCLSQPDMFLEQLRAILRASAIGPVRILIPMLAHNHEIDQALRFIAQAKAQLVQQAASPSPTRCRWAA